MNYALYIVRENNKANYYLSEYGGGAYNPAVFLQTLETARYELEELGMRSDAAYLMAGALYTDDMTGIPAERVGASPFRAIPQEQAETISTRVPTTVAVQVTLDFDAEEISYLFSKTGEKIRVSFDDALEALKQAQLSAKNKDGLERGTLNRLRACAQGEAPAMRMRG